MQTYTSILKLEISHPYYTDGRCRELLLTPFPETESLIKGHRLHVKDRPAGLEVFAPLKGDHLLLPLKARTRFRWFIRPISTLFGVITQLPKNPSRELWKFSNHSDETLYDPQVFSVFGGVKKNGEEIDNSLGFGREFLEREFTLEKSKNGANDSGQKICLDGLLPGTKKLFIQIEPDPGSWELEEGKYLKFKGTQAEEKKISVTYPVRIKGARNHLACIDLHLESEIVARPASPLSFELAFQAKEEHWSYLLVSKASNGFHLDSSSENWQLMSADGKVHSFDSIELDATHAPSSLNSTTGNINPTGNIQIADKAWNKLKQSILPASLTGKKAYFLRTSSSIPYHEKPKVQLQKKVGAAFENQKEQVAAAEADEWYHLPDPDPFNHGITFIQHPQKS